MGMIGLCVQFEQEILKFNGWHYFWRDMSQCASKMLNLQQNMQWSWMEIILNQMGQNDLVFDQFWLRFCTLWSNGYLCFQSLQQLWSCMTFVSKYGCFVTFVSRGKNLSNCLVLGISWLRPTSNNTKHTPWDPGLVSWVSKILCLIPDLSSSLGLSHVRTWCMHKNPFHSCSYPSGHWSAMNTPWFILAVQSSSLSAADLVCLLGEAAGSLLQLFLFSFCHQSNASVGGRAGSPLPPCLSTNT